MKKLVMLAMLLVACDRYSVQRQGDSTVRVDRVTGKTEVLRRGPDGSVRWEPVAEATPAVPATTPATTMLARRRATLPDAQVARLNVTGGFVEDPLNPYGGLGLSTTPRQFRLTVDNRSEWEVSGLQMRFYLKGADRREIPVVREIHQLEMFDTDITVDPGQSATFRHTAEASATNRWELIGAVGYQSKN